MERWPCTPLSAEGEPLFIYQRRWYLNPQWAHRASAQTVGGALPPGKYSAECWCEYAGYVSVGRKVECSFQKGCMTHTQIQNWTLAESRKTSNGNAFLDLLNWVMAMRMEALKNNKEVILYTVDWGLTNWGEHRSYTASSALVEELCLGRKSLPHSILLYCTISSSGTFCFFRHWCLHFP